MEPTATPESVMPKSTTPENSPLASTLSPASPAHSTAPMTGFFEGLCLDSEDGLPFTWFTKIVKVEPGEGLDIPQPVIAGGVAIAMHKPFVPPSIQGFRPQGNAQPPSYQFDYDHKLSGVHSFDGEAIKKFNPGDNHQGYTAYFLQQHVYDPSQMSYQQQQQLESFQVRQAALVPSTLTADQEEALAAKEGDRKAGQYNSAIRQIVTYEADKRVQLLNQLFDLKLKLSAGLGEDAVEQIRPLRRSAPLIQRLQTEIDKHDNRNEAGDGTSGGISGNEDDGLSTESK